VKPAPVIKEEPVPEEPPASLEPPAPVEEQDEPIDSFSDCYLSDEEPDQEDTPPAEEPASEADDDYDVLDDLLSDPAPEQQPESLAESSASVAKSDPEPVPEEQPDPAPEEQPKPVPEEQPIPEPDTEPEIDRNPEPKEGKELWAKYQDESDEYDWDILAFEVEECPIAHVEDEYQYYFREATNRFKDWVEYNGDLPKAPSCKEFADLIRVYKEDRDAEIIPTPSGCETMRLNKGKAREIPEERPKTDMEREWEAANGIIDEFDDEYFDEVRDMIDSI
ncbi:hypothetical protein RhiirA4_490339, partial [Rhizophagus irregularis]